MIGQKGIPATYGGVERHVEELATRLAARGHDVTVYCRRHYSPLVSEYRGVRLCVLPSVNTKHLDTVTHTALAVAHALAHPVDVLHFHSIGPAAFSILPRLLPKRARIIATLHGLDWMRAKWRWPARAFLRAAAWGAVRFPHRTIVVSKKMQEYFEARGKRTIHIPNGVETPFLRPLESLRRFGLTPDGYALWIGRFVPEKRVEDLIAAFRAFAGGKQLLLAGLLPENDGYVRRLKELAQGDTRIVFSGGLFGQERAEALSNAWLVALPSELEGFPIALLEGMRYGRPVIASEIPENLEALRPGINGLGYPAGDVSALTERLQWAEAHASEIATMARQAATDAALFDWDVITDKTEAVYGEC